MTTTLSRAGRVLLCIGLLAAGSTPAFAGHEFYVGPSGGASSDGSSAHPLDLATALSSNGPARPGDTIWLRGGTYHGAFISSIAGTSAAPIVVRQYAGERATIDSAPSLNSALTIMGGYVTFWGFEVTNSDPTRFSSQATSWPTDLKRGSGVEVRAPYVKLIDLVVHDLLTGILLDDWMSSEGSEAYGNIIYNNGWQAPDRSHGHGVYVQNKLGTRALTNNIIFNNFSHGIHAYGSDTAYLDNITLDGNIAFNNGVLGSDGYDRDMLIGGGRVAQSPIVTNNSTYGNAQTLLGYAGCAGGLVRDNYLVGASPLLLDLCTPVVTGNTLFSSAGYGFATLPSHYPDNTYETSKPTGLVIRLRPNLYEPGRAQVAVYNWDHSPQVQLDLAGAGLVSGDSFEIRNAQDFYGAPIVEGVYSGARVTISMLGHTVAQPIGVVPTMPQPTSPEFAALVVVRVATAVVPPPPATPPATAGAHAKYVSPSGAPSNDGSLALPLDLATALSSSGPVRPGDTVWLRGGTYRGTFVSRIAGTSVAPVVVRQYPGERATIDSAPSLGAALSILGGYVTFSGLEITNSDPLRYSAQSTPWPTDLKRGNGVEVHAPFVQLVALVVHDMTTGILLDDSAVSQGSSAYGNLVYNNGWQAPDGQRGNGIQVRNQIGTRTLAGNIVFNNFGQGIQAYGSSTDYLDNLAVDANILFNNGVLGAAGVQRDVLIGGGRVAQFPSLTNNSTYGAGQVLLGYSGCAGGVVRDNYLVGSSPLLLTNCSPSVTGNVLFSSAGYGFGDLPGLFPQNVYQRATPSGVIERWHQDAVDPGRAHVAIYNWNHSAAVQLDLSEGGLQIGQQYEIRSAQDFWSAPVQQGTYTGTPVTISMLGLTVAAPVGVVPGAALSTGPEFAALVLVKD